jgi:hypothetical protein
MINQQNVPFLVQNFGTDTHIVWDEENKIVKIANWGESGEDPIDITEQHAMAFTNSNTVEDACRLIELAYTAGCLMMPCFYDQFRKGREDTSVKSVFHGVPLIQTTKLFESVHADNAGGFLTDTSGKYYQFTPAFKLKGEDEKEVITQIMVSREILHDVPGTGNILTQDYCITGVNIPIKKGYFIRIMRGDVVCWGGYCNLTKPNIYATVHNGDGAAVCRKRWSAPGTVAYDPFGQPKKKRKVDTPE